MARIPTVAGQGGKDTHWNWGGKDTTGAGMARIPTELGRGVARIPTGAGRQRYSGDQTEKNISSCEFERMLGI